MYTLKKIKNDRWEWCCANSAYGLALGEEDTLAQAKIELAIAENEMFETPYSPAIVKAMRADPEHFAVDFTNK